jgi:hypothetical protein
MFKRSEIRHACYRAKKGLITESVQPILASVEPLLGPGQRWENFGKEWDVIITADKKLCIIKPETDYDFIHSTLVEAALYKRQGVDFDSFSDRQLSIINQVELLMLDGIMSWENYNKAWGVTIERDTNQLRTRQYNVKSTQIEVTEEMIQASKKDADGSVLTRQEPNVLEAEPMSAEQKRMFEEFLAKKYKGN